MQIEISEEEFHCLLFFLSQASSNFFLKSQDMADGPEKRGTRALGEIAGGMYDRLDAKYRRRDNQDGKVK